MILIADGGSTKADWVAINKKGEEVFRTKTLGINPEILNNQLIVDRLITNELLQKNKDSVCELYFYGAGCGTQNSKDYLRTVYSRIFKNAEIHILDDMLAAVYAASCGKESIVCILGTGSNSCYFDGKNVHQNIPSLGYLLMDEASANYFGKQLVRDFFYKRMPTEIAAVFNSKFDLSPAEIKRNLYKENSPNSYLGEFATVLFDFKEHAYVQQLLTNGFKDFFDCRVVSYPEAKRVPIFFIGSIAFYFQNLLENTATKMGLQFGGVIQRPIDGLIQFHILKMAKNKVNCKIQDKDIL